MKNTITKLFALAALAGTVLAGCSSLKEEGGNASKDAIKFTASIGTYQVKATDTAFEEGDVIGLFAEHPVGVQNLPMTWSNGSLVPETPVYWGSNQFVDQASAFYAYYPYSAVQNDIYVEGFTVQEDQTTHEGYTASDLMIASTLASPAEGTVNLNFIHRMTKLVFHVENRLTDENVAAITVGNVYVSANGDFGLDGEIHSTGDPGSVKAGKIVLETGETAWQAIIAPFQYVKPAILITMESGKEYVYNADFEVYFSPSRCYNATVIIDETSVSTDFTSNITDWWDGGWFWFSQNVPSPYDGEWSLIGTIYDTMWDTDFQMRDYGDGLWYFKLAYRSGQEFKFRMNHAWDVNFGGVESNTDGWQTMLSIGEAVALAEGGPNLMLPEDGYYEVYLNTGDQTATVYYAGELRTYDGIVIWEGSAYMSGWQSEDYNHMLGSEYAWVDNGLKAGDEIRIYYDASNINADYWVFQIYAPHWENLEAGSFDSYGYPETSGYVSYIVKEDELKLFVNPLDWGGAMIIMGDGNVEIQAITLVPGESGPVELDQIQPIVDAENDTEVEVTQVVYAQSSRGFVLFDGKYSIFVYTGADSYIPATGDIVKVKGKKTIYNNVPEITTPTYEVVGSAANEMMDVIGMCWDVSHDLDNGFASIAIPVYVEGVLQADAYTIKVDGQTFKVSLYYPYNFDFTNLVNHKIRVYGFYNGRRDTSSLVYLIPMGVEDYGEVEPVDPPSDSPFISNVTWELGERAYVDNTLNVTYGDYTFSDVPNVKLGTSSKAGNMKLNLPAGTTGLSFWAIGWNGKDGVMVFTIGNDTYNVTAAANTGAANSSPYNVTVQDTDHYSLSFPAALAEDTVASIETTSAGYRAFIFGVVASN